MSHSWSTYTLLPLIRSVQGRSHWWTNWAADVGLREENMGAEEGWAVCGVDVSFSLILCKAGHASQRWNPQSAQDASYWAFACAGHKQR